MTKFPTTIEKTFPSPMKSQGIKTKLVGHIAESFVWDGEGTFREPFAGTGVVALNLRPCRVHLSDINPHAITLLKDIREKRMTGKSIKEFLESEGAELQKRGAEHYLDIRRRFNEHGGSHEFVFLNRAGFNGMVRFNGKGGLNVPFCKKPGRFSRSYITKIVNLVEHAGSVMRGGDWTFSVEKWQEALSSLKGNDFVYLDPPYTARNADYYSSWKDEDSDGLADFVKSMPCGWAYSMWIANRHRTNTHVLDRFGGYPTNVIEHAYHVGATEKLRGSVYEGIIVAKGFETDKCRPLAFPFDDKP